MRSVLIVDDEKHTRDGLSAVLADSYDVFAASNADEAISMLDAEPFDAVITDLRMAGKSGMSVIDKTISMPEKPVCIMLTAYGSMEIAVEAMKRGATDFLPKPVDVDKLETILEQALEKREQKKKIVESENKKNIETAKKAHGTSSVVEAKHIDIGCFIATSKVMKEVVEKAMQVAHSKASVMLTGETGTGKELFARLIHSASPRKDAPFLPVHCAALPANLLESELFGYERGAFTGANQRRIGRFEAADKGTIFLDEIGEIDAQTQVKLLRFLETKTFERLGSSQSLKVDVRLVCATNKDLKAMCDHGEYREDLYYRLNVVEIKIPPLREHPEDIKPLLESYIAYFARENEIEPVKISAEALAILEKYEWAGNIRELRNFCENIVVMNPTRTLTAENLDAKFLSAKPRASGFSKKENELELIKKAIEAAGGNKSKAAEMLGISRRTLHRKLDEAK
ncbi:MAG: sigma-54-dependent Fis family transcriptional regulator [Opitutales bacterium]|nr:sigma-54-dependent Fis family transcriptional regulator [Opitutales bacterium]